MRINKKTFLDNFVLLLIVLQCFILGFFGYNGLLNRIISALILVRIIVLLLEKRIGNKSFLILCSCIMIFAIDVVVQGFRSDVVKSNFLLLFYPMLYLYFIYVYNILYPVAIKNLIEKYYIALNALLLINFAVVYYQATTMSLIPAAEYITIDFGADTYTGLFMYGGTHCLCLFNIFVILIDLKKLLDKRKLIRRVIGTLYILFLIALSLWVSTLNDNKSFIVLLPIYIVVLLIHQMSLEQKNYVKKQLKNYLRFILVGLSVFMILYFTNDFINLTVNEYLFSIVDAVIKSSTNQLASNGSNERITMVLHFLSYPNIWLFGTGIGNTSIYSSGLLGFRHFGISSLGAILILGGFMLTVSLYSFYVYILTQLTKSQNNLLYVLFIIIVVSLYTQILFTPSLMFTFILSVLALFYFDNESVVVG